MAREGVNGISVPHSHMRKLRLREVNDSRSHIHSGKAKIPTLGLLAGSHAEVLSPETQGHLFTTLLV